MKIKIETIIRTAVLAFALVNQMLLISGFTPLPFSETEFYTFVSGLLTVTASLLAWWKNNSFTEKAIKADKFLQVEREESNEL